MTSPFSMVDVDGKRAPVVIGYVVGYEMGENGVGVGDFCKEVLEEGELEMQSGLIVGHEEDKAASIFTHGSQSFGGN